MKRTNRILLAAGCAALLLISWLTAITADTDAQKQEKLLAKAEMYMEDEIYVLAEPLYQEASSYEDKYTAEAEIGLKKVYLALLDQTGYAKKYKDLLSKQMGREGAPPEVFLEAAKYYFGIPDEEEAFIVLRDGIEKTKSQEILDFYEASRYTYTTNYVEYEDVTAVHQGAIQVQMAGKWGLADHLGHTIIPCEYDMISTFGEDRVVVKKDNVISAVNSKNNRLALYHGDAKEFGNYGENRLALKTDNGWTMATGELAQAPMEFEDIGMFSGGCAPAKVNGKWGLIQADGESWLLAPTYDDIIRDELGRCFAQGRVFVKQGKQVIMLSEDGQVGETYQDAKPFADGWAAVKKDGKWGFVDAQGVMQIEPQYEDALSYGQHLAAVKIDGKWGYISIYGKIAIEPIFEKAKSFYQGSAPVQAVKDTWQFITLTEYEE